MEKNIESNTTTTTTKSPLYIFPYNNVTLPNYVQESGDATLVDAFTHRVFDIVNYVVLSGLIGLFGTIANMVNMLVFIRIGLFTSASNLNLFSLAIADLGVSFTILAQSIGYAVITADIPNLTFDPFDVVYITISWPNMIFTMANRLITPYVALERCVCVVAPFKVKTLFTTNRSLVCLSILFAYSILSHVPIFATHYLQHIIQENSNASKLVLVFSAHSDIMYDICINTNVFVVSFATVILVFALTLITASQIKTSAKWRKTVSMNNTGSIGTSKSPSFTSNTVITDVDSKSVGPSRPNVVSNDESSRMEDKESDNVTVGKSAKMTDKAIDKETRLVKMITFVSVIYIVLYMPEMLMIVVMFIDKRISTYGQYWRLSEIFYSFTYPTGALNSSINIFVYYKMSTAFRREFKKLTS